MKKLWNYIDKKNIKATTKYKFAFFIIVLLSGLLGYILWLIFRNFGLSSGAWMFCFIGYPVLISFYITVLYAYNHEFHDKKR